MPYNKKVTIVIPCWKRYFIFNFIAQQLNNIKNKFRFVNVVVGISPEDEELENLINICKKYNFKFVYVSNDFLGSKLNDLIKSAFDIFPDTEYIMNCGSDDLIHEKLFKLYLPYIKSGEKIFGIDKVYFWDINSDDTLLFTYDNEKIIGAGRMLHKSLPFPIYNNNCQSALDGNSLRYLLKRGYNPIQINVSDFPYIVDVKSDVNICNFNNFIDISNRVSSDIIRENYNFKISVNSYNCEFGYELLSCVPYAYWLNEHGLLKETISGKQSEPLYYFSPNHKISENTRSYKNIHKVKSDGVPNAKIHVPYLDFSTFKIPPYKEIYANNKYKFDKPIVCICNRYNKEWNNPPINFFDLDCLGALFNELQNKYQVVYFATSIPENIQDGAHSIDLGDYEFAKQFPNVIIFQDLVTDNWNKTLLKVFANCERFITMNGGYSILASFFGGQNIIYSKRGMVQTSEINIGSFWRWYPEFNNAQIKYVSTYDELFNAVDNLFVKNLPTVNILIRTCERHSFFNKCIASIVEQTYPNINVIVGIENSDAETIEYANKYPYRIVHYPKVISTPAPEESEDYGLDFPFNKYLDILTQKVGNGYILYLDDDDCLVKNTSIEEMVKAIKNYDLLFWRVDFKNRIIPSNLGWIKLKRKVPTVCDISGIGFMFHSKFKNFVDWGYWKRGDYRVVKKLCSVCKVKLIDSILTSIQTRPHKGIVNNIVEEKLKNNFSIFQLTRMRRFKNNN